ELESIGDHHFEWARQLNDAAQAAQSVYRPQVVESLGRKTRTAALNEFDGNTRLWVEHAGAHQEAGSAIHEVAGHIRDLRSELFDIADAGEATYVAALKQGDTHEAKQILADAGTRADGAVDVTVQRIKDKFASLSLHTDTGRSHQDHPKPDDRDDQPA